jgi:hypothetical protein
MPITMGFLNVEPPATTWEAPCVGCQRLCLQGGNCAAFPPHMPCAEASLPAADYVILSCVDFTP